MKKIAIIGAGYSGLSIAALLAKYGYYVTVFEKHGELGGCAGYFSRGKDTFDAGATTLSGLRDGGPFRKILDVLNLAVDVLEVEDGIRIISNEHELIIGISIDSTIEQFNKAFPHFDSESFWRQMKEDQDRALNLVSNLSYIQFPSVENISKLLTTELFSKLRALPLLTKSFYDVYLKPLNVSKEVEKVIDEILMISTQSTSKDVPALFGILGVMYPFDLWCAKGGMKSLMYKLKNLIKKFDGTIYLSEKVEKINLGKDFFLIETAKRKMSFDYVISCVPNFSLENIVDGSLKDQLSLNVKKSLKKWSAITSYFIIETEEEIPGTYYQFLIADAPFGKSGSIFISLSHIDDEIRTKGNRRLVTISYHTDATEWKLNERDEEYKRAKNCIKVFCEKSLQAVFEQYKITKLRNTAVGTPLTFQRYTNREKGFLGGIPYSLNDPLFLHQRTKTSVSNFYCLSDTTIPGQSIYSLSLSSLNLLGYIKKVSLI